MMTFLDFVILAAFLCVWAWGSVAEARAKHVVKMAGDGRYCPTCGKVLP